MFPVRRIGSSASSEGVSVEGYAVFDVETTGFSPARGDRIVEIGVVLLHPSGVPEGEWETLLNPLRDVGPSWVHGIDDDEVQQAPLFGDVAGALAELFADRVLVAHNLAFDARFLGAEFAEAGHDLGVDARAGVCTMRYARRVTGGTCTLEACCERHGISQRNAHRALHDARATAQLLRVLSERDDIDRHFAEEMRRSLAIRWPLGLPTASPLPRP